MYRFISRVIDRNNYRMVVACLCNWHHRQIIDGWSDVPNKNCRGQLDQVVSDRVDTSDEPFLDKTTASFGNTARKSNVNRPILNTHYCMWKFIIVIRNDMFIGIKIMLKYWNSRNKSTWKSRRNFLIGSNV